MRFFLSISAFKSEAIGFLRFKNAFNGETIRIIANSTRRRVISDKIPSIIWIKSSSDNNISYKSFSSEKSINEIFSFFRRFYISKLRRNKFAARIVERESKKRLGTETKEATDVLNMRENVNIRKPSISKKNDMTIAILLLKDVLNNYIGRIANFK